MVITPQTQAEVIAILNERLVDHDLIKWATVRVKDLHAMTDAEYAEWSRKFDDSPGPRVFPVDFD